jgi:myo-inositol-1(or 4)-monophosphatase
VTAGDNDVDLLVEAAREAGVLAMTFFRNEPKNWPKGEKSIVSEADIALDRFLASRLLTARPDYGWLSEETVDNPARLDRRRAFVVDPIDGTRGFLAGGTDWTVSLAVVEDGRSTAAVLFAPALDSLFQAEMGRGAMRDGVRLEVSPRKEVEGARIVGSRRLVREAREIRSLTLEYHGHIASLAYQLALVAEGCVDVGVMRRGAYDWDLAAADLLVHEAGGRLTDLHGNRPRYNGVYPRHPTLLAATPALIEPMASLVAEADLRHIA